MAFNMVEQLAAKGFWVFSGSTMPDRFIIMRKEGRYSTLDVTIRNNKCTFFRMRKGITILASGYEWICPNMSCHEYNYQPGVTEEVTCFNCGKTYEVRDHIHAYGR